MKIAVFCNGAVLQPSLEVLFSQGLLAGVVVPEGAGGDDVNLPLEMALRQAAVPFLRVKRSSLSAQLAPWLEEISPDVVCCMGFPAKIPAELLEIPRFGFYNFHGGHLPHYRGPDPVFWQIRNREPYGAITIHRMTAEIDCGAIAHAELVRVGDEDTHHLHLQRLGATMPRVLIEFVQQLAIHGEQLPLQQQDATQSRYLPRPSDSDRTVDWSWTAGEIDAIVRACNPVYGGALTFLKGIPLRILETSPAPPCVGNQTLPGTVLSASGTEGLRIACGQGESLVIEIIYAMDGFFSGKRLAKIFGLRPGDSLG